METLVQEVESRTRMGKKVKALRRDGLTPANIYGSGIESVAIQASTLDLENMISTAGSTRIITLKNPAFDEDRSVLIKSTSRDPLSGKLLHVDFYQVSLKDKVKVEVPILLEGEAPAAKRKDLVVLEGISSVEVECLPTDIPENIIVDISNLVEAGEAIMVSEIKLDDKVTMLTNPEDVIVRVDIAKVEVEEEEVEGEEVEGEGEEAAEGEAPAAEEASAEGPPQE